MWIAQRPPGFGFVLMSCTGEAEDAVRGLHGTRMCGNRSDRRGGRGGVIVINGLINDILQGYCRNDKR